MVAAAPPVIGGFAACHCAARVIAASPLVIAASPLVIAATPLSIGLRPSMSSEEAV